MAAKLFLAFRLVLIPALIAFIMRIEAHRAPDYFRLLTFIAFFLLLVDLATLIRGAVRNVLIVCASLAFGLSIVEGVAYRLEPKQTIVFTDGYIDRRPMLGWGPNRAGRFHSEKTDATTGALIYSVDYTIDSNLLRETHSSETDPTIAFFGCSFTFGDGVADSETMPQAFADLLNHKQRVLNLGFTGYGPQQFLREMETGLFDSAIGQQPTLFIFLTGPWHAERSSCKASWVAHGPRYELENGEVKFKGDCFDGNAASFHEWIWNSAAYRNYLGPLMTRVTHDDIETYIGISLAAVKLAKEKYGVPTLIPFVPAAPNYLSGTGFDNDAIAKRLQDGGALVIDVSLAKEQAAGAKIAIEGDGHPTPLANSLRAQLLKSYVEQHVSSALHSARN